MGVAALASTLIQGEGHLARIHGRTLVSLSVRPGGVELARAHTPLCLTGRSAKTFPSRFSPERAL
jgi:hypothetical protein